MKAHRAGPISFLIAVSNQPGVQLARIGASLAPDGRRFDPCVTPG